MNILPFTLKQLVYLVTASQEGSIAAAAQTLHLSPSAIADGISDLERTLGAALTLRRRAHGLTLTSAGVAVVNQAIPLLAAARELGSTFHAAPGELVGPITIGCYPTLAPTVLPPLLHDFGAAHPRVELNIVEAAQDRMVERVLTGEVDVAFVYDMLIPDELRKERLCELPAYVLLPANDPLADRDAIDLQDLVDRDLIMIEAQPSAEHTLSMFQARGLTPKIRHRTSNYEAVRTLVARGLGYGILVQRPANMASYEGYPLLAKEITPTVAPVSIDIIWSAAISPPERVRALIQFAKSITWTGPS